MQLTKCLVDEAARQLTVCNACRYCEGYCPVFPAIEIRRSFDSQDICYLANLCHDCRACYNACMYAPPHEFEINLPRILAECRIDSYRALSWPSFMSRAFFNWKIAVSIPACIIAVSVIPMLWSLVSHRLLTTAQHGPGAFYRLISFQFMLLLFSLTSLIAALVLAKGAIGFWWSADSRHGGFEALGQSLWDALSLRWLRGGGPGCYYPRQKPSSSRRIFHALTFFGFLSAGISTLLAGFYQHALHRLPPYPVLSAPVLFGIIGGAGMVIGTSALVLLKGSSDSEPTDKQMLDADYVFLVLVNLASSTGILTLILRNTSALPLILSLHLSLVAAFFCSLPYSKFVHAIYRSLALFRYRIEHSSRMDSLN
jgi:citrate/tricarballylate utilization protein